MPRVSVLSLAVISVCIAAPALAQAVPTMSPLQVKDILGIREFADRVQVDLSSDGKFVAFTLRDPVRAAPKDGATYFGSTGVPRGQRGTDIFVTEVLTSKTTKLTADRGSNWSPVWSPDGRTLAFLSDRDGQVRVWLWDRPRKELRRLALDPVRTFYGFEGIRWSPNGRRLAVKLSPAGMSRAQLDRLLPSGVAPTPVRPVSDAGVTATVFDATGAPRDTSAPPAPPPLALNLDSTRSFLNAELADLAIIDLNSGRVKRVASRVRVMGWHWSPDGARVAFSTRQPDGGRGLLVYDNYDLFVVDTSGKQPPRLIVPRMVQEYGLTFSWSPNGRLLAFESDSSLHIVSRDSGDSRVLPAGDRTFTEGYRAPLWLNDDALMAKSADTLWRISVATGNAAVIATPTDRRLLEIVASADAQRFTRRSVAVAVSDPVSKVAGFRMYDLATGTMTGRFEEDAALGATDLAYNLDASADGRTIAYVAERSDRPAEVMIAPEQLTHSNRVTNLNPQVTRLALGGTKLVQWTGPPGVAGGVGGVLRGALLMPANYEPGKRFPLIVKVYGGSLLSGRLNRFGLEPGIDNLQMLATRGYAVLLPDTPLRIGKPMSDLAADVLPAVDSVIAMGIADPTRLGLMGHSYGGYSVLAILVQTNRFKAAVSSGGFSNLFSQYGEMREDGSAVGIGWSERDQGRMGGSPWEFRDRYIENSPFFFFDRMRTPVLLLHGGADQTVLPARAAETFVALRRLGREVQLVRYEGEQHHPGSWSVANATDYWQRIFVWFDRYMVAR